MDISVFDYKTCVRQEKREDVESHEWWYKEERTTFSNFIGGFDAEL